MLDSDTQNLSFGQTQVMYGSGANITVGTPPAWHDDRRQWGIV